MENLRYLLAAIAALTLIMSVVSSVNPSYFAGLNALADEEDDDNNCGTTNNHEEEDDDEHEADDGTENDKGELKLEQILGTHSNATLEIGEDAELGVEIEDGDLDDGIHDVSFACDSPDVSKAFADSLNVTEGHGEFDTDLGLLNDTYTGCEVKAGNLSADFPTFTVLSEVHDDEDDQDEEDDEEHEEEDDDNASGSSSGSNRNDDDEEKDEEDEDDYSAGSRDERSAEVKHKEKQERIVSSTSGTELHERHRNANPHSSGEYDPGWNYTLAANGTAMQAIENQDLLQEEDSTVNLNMSVWKSNSAIILFDIVGGTVEIADHSYEIRIGYGIYSLNHDAIKVIALGTDADGNVYSLRLRGNAVDEVDQFATESNSIDLLFGGNIDQSNNRFEDWGLLLEGTVEAN